MKMVASFQQLRCLNMPNTSIARISARSCQYIRFYHLNLVREVVRKAVRKHGEFKLPVLARSGFLMFSSAGDIISLSTVP